jgi:ABC-type multidrug transport system ATPase subunit
MTPFATSSILQIDDLHFAYPDQPALANGWTASIGDGLTQLYGDTGSGKSTLLRALAGVQPASGGQLRVAGVALDAEPEAYRRQVFFCEPASEAFDPLGVQACTALLGEGDAGFDQAEWQRLVEAFSLVPHLDKQMFMLSTGSRRKVGLAAALASGRPVVLLDDPVAALDARSIHGLWQAIGRRVAQPGRSVIVASSERITAVPLAACIELPLG